MMKFPGDEIISRVLLIILKLLVSVNEWISRSPQWTQPPNRGKIFIVGNVQLQ